MFKPRMDFLTKVILFSIVIVRCAAAKEIEGLTIENKIEKGNLPDGYFIEQSCTEMIREKIDGEVIRAFDCMEESMASWRMVVPIIGPSGKEHKFSRKLGASLSTSPPA